MAGMPPRKTLQGGRGLTADPEAPGGVRVFTKEPQRMEAAWMRGEFARRLPAGWTPRTDPARVRVELVYPARKSDKAKVAVGKLIPHAVRPDADNLVKSLLDALTGAGVWADDGQVWDLRVRKWRGERPRWAVFIWWGGEPLDMEARRIALDASEGAGTCCGPSGRRGGQEARQEPQERAKAGAGDNREKKP